MHQPFPTGMSGGEKRADYMPFPDTKREVGHFAFQIMNLVLSKKKFLKIWLMEEMARKSRPNKKVQMATIRWPRKGSALPYVPHNQTQE